jgi:hypothetical protein
MESKKIQKIRLEGINFADKKCRKLHMGGVPFNNKYNRITLEIEL